MNKSMQISLRAGERIYLNGAVVRCDRKVTLELMNDAVFLLEGHVLQVEETTTPLRQLYFVVQMMLMDPANAAAARALFHDVHPSVVQAFRSDSILAGLRNVAALVEGNRGFEALRTLRTLFPIEHAILQGEVKEPQAA